MATLINRLRELRDTIRSMLSASRISRATRREALAFGNFMRNRLRENTPDGSKWIEPSEVFNKRERFPALQSPRPSLRLHGVTLSDSYGEPEISTDSRVTGGRGQITVEIPSNAPQARWVIEGTKSHVIPNNIGVRKLFFNHFAANKVRWMDFVVHNGISPNDYVQETFNQERDNIEQRFTRFFRRISTRPIEVTFG